MRLILLKRYFFILVGIDLFYRLFVFTHYYIILFAGYARDVSSRLQHMNIGLTPSGIPPPPTLQQQQPQQPVQQSHSSVGGGGGYIYFFLCLYIFIIFLQTHS